MSYFLPHLVLITLPPHELNLSPTLITINTIQGYSNSSASSPPTILSLFFTPHLLHTKKKKKLKIY